MRSLVAEMRRGVDVAEGFVEGLAGGAVGGLVLGRRGLGALVAVGAVAGAARRVRLVAVAALLGRAGVARAQSPRHVYGAIWTARFR